MSATLDIVTISGSLRQGSFNTALLDTLPELAPASLTFRRLEFRHLPIYDGDLEHDGLPIEAVQSMQREIRRADGIVIATPEYNHGVPGGLKNAIDWLSRGPAPHGLYEVPSAILGASNGMIGTARSQNHLRQTLVTLTSPTMPQPQVLVSHAQKKIDSEGRLTDEPTREFLRGWLVAVERWMRRFPRSERG